MALDFGSIAAIVTNLVEGAKFISSRLPDRSLGASNNSTPAELIAALEPRLAAIENHEGEQDALVKGLAEQLENLAAASEVLNSKVRLLIVLAGSAAVVSVGVLLLVLLRG